MEVEILVDLVKTWTFGQNYTTTPEPGVPISQGSDCYLLSHRSLCYRAVHAVFSAETCKAWL